MQHVGSFDFFDWVNPIVKKWKEEIRVQIDWLHKELKIIKYSLFSLLCMSVVIC